jgi:hypothetical protein
MAKWQGYLARYKSHDVDLPLAVYTRAFFKPH